MIRYSLSCDQAHEFEGWFSTAADFDSQSERGLLSCPICGSQTVAKTLMAPSIATSRRKEASHALAIDEAQKSAVERMKQAIAEIKAKSEDVGERFAEEARRIHYGEASARGIIGQASIFEARALLEEGIDIAPLPVLPDEAN